MSDDGFITTGSGQQEHFEGGSRRDTQEGKPRYSLISPRGLYRLAMLHVRGSDKYGDYNWELGQPTSRVLDSLMRHVEDYRRGDRTEDHLAAIAWNAFAIMHFEDSEWDDRHEWTIPPRPTVVETVELEADPELLAGVSRGFGVERSLAPDSPTWGDLGAQVGDVAATAVHVGWLWIRRHI